MSEKNMPGGIPRETLGLLGDIFQKVAAGALSHEELQQFAKRQNPFESVPKEETPLDTIIRVDRSIHSVYPDWMKEVMHPELEVAGPSEYDLTKAELYLHDGQKGGKKRGGDNSNCGQKKGRKGGK